MRVLVTGHKGYIGTVMTPMLLARGHDVAGLDSDLYRECSFGNGMVDVPWIQKDIRDVDPKELEGFEAVIHLAALSNDPLGDLDPDLTDEINHQAAVRLADCAKQAGVKRFLFSSSCSTYGSAGEELVAEDAPFRPVTVYGQSKVDVEQDVAPMADSSFTPVFFRSATAYGVSPRLRFDLVLNNLVGWAFATGSVHLKSDGTPWRPIVHIEDIARAFCAGLEAPREVVHNQAFNVGRNGENYRMRELADIVHDVVPGCTVGYAENAGPDKRCYRVDFNKIERDLAAFKPQWTARLGVEQLHQAYGKTGLLLEEFEGPKYKRVDHIKHQIEAGRLDTRLRWR